MTNGSASHPWLVVDTGSGDRTIEIAQERGARVLRFPWCDDFAAARNHGLPHARGTWTLVLDADDRLQQPDGLRAWLESDPDVDVAEVLVESPLGPGAAAPRERAWLPRLFRTAAGVRYRNAIHEVPRIAGLRVGRAPARVLHLGYADVDRRRRSAERVLRMLPLLATDDPHAIYHRLRALVVLQRDAEVLDAVAALSAATDDLPPDVRLHEAQALLRQGRAGAALRSLMAAIEDYPTHPDPYFGLVLASTLAWLAAARKLREQPELLHGPTTSLDHVLPVAEALVQAGLFNRGLLDKPLVQVHHHPPGGDRTWQTPRS